MYNGIINIYKEAGFTSHDVVAKLRGILKQKKIGHTGTLDPEAVGVLPVCLGKGTKVCDLLTEHRHTLIGSLTELTSSGHVGFPPYQDKLAGLRPAALPQATTPVSCCRRWRGTDPSLPAC